MNVLARLARLTFSAQRDSCYMLRCLFASRGDDQFYVRRSVDLPPPAAAFLNLAQVRMSVAYWHGTGREFPFLQRCACKATINSCRSDESRGADRNVVNIAGSAQLAQEEHRGPGGLFENIAQGWCRPVQAHGAPHTWLLYQGELLT